MLIIEFKCYLNIDAVHFFTFILSLIPKLIFLSICYVSDKFWLIYENETRIKHLIVSKLALLFEYSSLFMEGEYWVEKWFEVAYFVSLHMHLYICKIFHRRF